LASQRTADQPDHLISVNGIIDGLPCGELAEWPHPRVQEHRDCASDWAGVKLAREVGGEFVDPAHRRAKNDVAVALLDCLDRLFWTDADPQDDPVRVTAGLRLARPFAASSPATVDRQPTCAAPAGSA
jgi:hypothetical protein